MRSIFPTTRYSTVVPTTRSVYLFISANKISEAVHRQEEGGGRPHDLCTTVVAHNAPTQHEFPPFSTPLRGGRSLTLTVRRTEEKGRGALPPFSARGGNKKGLQEKPPLRRNSGTRIMSEKAHSFLRLATARLCSYKNLNRCAGKRAA